MSSNEVATTENTPQTLTISEGQNQFTPMQVAALRNIGVENASEGDLAVFFHQVQRTGLDPFTRQIYMIARKQKNRRGEWETKQTIQTGIDGFRLVAHRAALKQGVPLSVDDTLWADWDGNWHDLWINRSQPPAAAKVTVHVGESHVSAVAMFTEYAAVKEINGREQLTGMWRKMPALMIAKCAEALALRKAFPIDLSGVYAPEEMDQADNHSFIEGTVAEQPAQAQRKPARTYQQQAQPASEEQQATVREWAEQLGWDAGQLNQMIAWWQQHEDKTPPGQLSNTQAPRFVAYMRDRLDKERQTAEQPQPLPGTGDQA